MTEKKIPFNNLMEQVLTQLKDQGYMDSTLAIYRRIYNRVHVFINQHDIDIYTRQAGDAFLSNTHVSEHTLSFYACAVRRLNDYVEGNVYRCHHGNPTEAVTKRFAGVLDSFLSECRNSGNSPATILSKEKSCIAFLNCIEQTGCIDLSNLDADTVSQGLLIFANKDNFARIRLFLKYLADTGVTRLDLSGVVPRYKRQKALPTTYTPAEINKVEAAVDVSTDIGKRNLAIIRLATRMGFRSGDIARLKWSEVDFDTGYIRFTQEKTGVPLALQMPQEVYDSLLQHFDNLKHTPEDCFVFHSMSAPYGRITTSIIRHVVTNSFIAAGINISGKRHGPHTFRSSLASSMINDGASYETVRKILGHTSTNVLRHYAKTDVENLRFCSIEPPAASGIFSDYLSGKKVISHV